MKTLIAIIAVLAVFAGLYLAFPAGIFMESVPDTGVVREDNGIVGRFIDGMGYLYWNPALFALFFVLLGTGSIGIAKYWKSVKD